MTNPHPKKYKVVVKDVVPGTHQLSKTYLQSCFIGISLGNPIFNTKHLPALFEWAESNFQSCSVVIADYIYRHTLQIEYGLSEKEALQQALSLGQLKKAECESLVPADVNLKVYQWQDQGAFSSSEYLEAFEKKVLANENIVRDIDIECDLYLKRRKGIEYTNYIANMTLARRYMIEEMAFINYQAERGSYYSIYPGTQLTILKNISSSLYPVYNLPMKKVIYIDLSIKK